MVISVKIVPLEKGVRDLNCNILCDAAILTTDIYRYTTTDECMITNELAIAEGYVSIPKTTTDIHIDTATTSITTT